jgi:hypothetical protein
MTGSSWLRSGAVVVAAVLMMLLAIAPAAYSKKKTATPTPTPTLTPTATATPEVKTWNFDQDKAGAMPAGWKAVEGDWTVIADPTAPSQPNTFGLPAGRLISSLTHALEYYPEAIVADPTEYSDFIYEAAFKSVGGRFDCSGGLIFRYVNDKNYYVLSAGCPNDYFGLSRVLNGQMEVLKQSVVPTDKDNWYKIKVRAQGGHFMCYDDTKMVFDFDDNKIAKGRLGLWTRDDSEVRFDNVSVTKLAAGAASGEGAATPAPSPSLPSLPN